MMESGSESLELKNSGADDVPEESRSRRWCVPCKEDGESLAGLAFCLDCQEVYCKLCTESHKKFKVSKHHKLIDVKQISSEASRVGFFSSFTKCQNHAVRDIDFYCNDHNVVICVLCLKEHHKLCNTDEISSHGLNTDTLKRKTNEVASGMKAAVDHLNMLQAIRQENKQVLKNRLNEIKDEIKQVRESVVKLMNEVVTRVSDVAKQLELENEDRLDEEMSRVAKVKQLTRENLILLDTTNQHGSEKHKFISAHLMESQSKEINRMIYEEDERLRTIDANLIIADDRRKLVEGADVKKLVKVQVSESICNHRHLGAVSNYLRDSKLVKVEEHTVRPNSKHHPFYMGVAMRKDGTLIVSDYCANSGCGYICLYNPTNKSMQKLNLNPCPFSAAHINNTHIAVSIPDNNIIRIVTVDTELRVEKTLNTQNTPRSIVALSNGELAMAWDKPPAFGVIDICGATVVQKSYFEQDKTGRKFKPFRYLAVDEKRGHVIQSCHSDKAVYCFTLDGEPVFTYTESKWGYPEGVALDGCGNIYICGYANVGNIHKLSPTGELVSIITEGVPCSLQAICIDNTGAGLWVTQLDSYDRVVYFRLEQRTQT